MFFSFSIYSQRSTIVRLQTFFFVFSVYSFSQVWPVNLMKLLIHGLLEKIRFHINQVFENFYKTFSNFFFLFSTQKSISYLHTNLLTVKDTEKQSENLFSYQPLIKQFKNFLTIATFSHYFFSPQTSVSYLP